MQDAREQQQEAGKPRKKHRKENHREIARRRKSQNPETERQPLGQEEKDQKRQATRPKQKSPKNPKKCLDVAEHEGVRIAVPECVQDTLGGTKTSGPPGTAEVSVPPEPEKHKSSTQKGTRPTQTHILHSFIKKNKSSGRCHLLPWGGEKGTKPETIGSKKGQSLKGDISSDHHLHSQPRDNPETFIQKTYPERPNKIQQKEHRHLGCLDKRGGGAHGPPLSSGKSSQGTRAPRVQVNSPLWEPPPRRKKQEAT